MRSDFKYIWHTLGNFGLMALVSIIIMALFDAKIAAASILIVLIVCAWLEVLGMRIRDDILDGLKVSKEINTSEIDNSDLLRLPDKTVKKG